MLTAARLCAGGSELIYCFMSLTSKLYLEIGRAHV